MKYTPLYLALTCCALVSGCTLGPDYRRPDGNLPQHYSLESSNQSGQISRDWWRQFNDPTLDSLIDRALQQNADIRLAAARIEESDAVMRQAGAAFFPEIDLGGSASKTRPSRLTGLPVFGPGVRNNFKLNLNSAFELDFWGKLRRADEEARARALETRYGRATVELTLEGLIAQNYLSLRSLDAQLAVSRESLESREATLKITRDRAAAGLASQLDVAQAEGFASQLSAQIETLSQSRELALDQLALLTAQPGLSLAPGDLRRIEEPVAPPSGLPSTLLDSRPDIRQAEAQLVAANANIGIARAALFPSISLTASYGGESAVASNVTRSGAKSWSFGPSLTLPFFDAGKRRALLDQANSQQKQALIGYQKSIENAFKEVSDALVNLQQTARSAAALDSRLKSAKQALEISEQRYRAGYSAYLDVLDAERNYNDASLASIQNRQARLGALVDLFKALGGGWKPS